MSASVISGIQPYAADSAQLKSRSVGSLFLQGAREVRSLAGGGWTWLKSLLVWLYDWWYGKNCLKSGKLKPSPKNKTTDIDKDQDEKVDLEAADRKSVV